MPDLGTPENQAGQNEQRALEKRFGPNRDFVTISWRARNTAIAAIRANGHRYFHLRPRPLHSRIAVKKTAAVTRDTAERKSWTSGPPLHR